MIEHRQIHFLRACALIAVAILPIASAAAADAPLAPAAASLMTVGTAGGPNPRAHRAQSANLLTIGGVMYLIDAGDGTLRELAKAHVRYASIRNVFITHLHDDHYAGLAPIIALKWEFGGGQPLDVYGPPGTATMVAGALAYLSPNTTIRATERGVAPSVDLIRGHDIGVGAVFADANVRVSAVENTHFHFPPGSAAAAFKSYASRFDTPAGSIVFTGDTGPSPAVTQLARGADVLVSEVITANDYLDTIQAIVPAPLTDQQKSRNVAHMSLEHMLPENVGKLATAAGVKLVILTHFPSRTGGNDDYSDYLPLVRAHYSGPVVLAHDDMVFPLGKP